MKVILIIFLLVLNIPVYKYLFNKFFDTIYDFNECLRYLLTHDLISLSRGEYLKDQWHETKFMFFIFCCISAVGIEYLVIYIILYKVFL